MSSFPAVNVVIGEGKISTISFFALVPLAFSAMPFCFFLLSSSFPVINVVMGEGKIPTTIYWDTTSGASHIGGHAMSTNFLSLSIFFSNFFNITHLLSAIPGCQNIFKKMAIFLLLNNPPVTFSRQSYSEPVYLIHVPFYRPSHYFCVRNFV